jgi:hypothetical protein
MRRIAVLRRAKIQPGLPAILEAAKAQSWRIRMASRPQQASGEEPLSFTVPISE